jgi:hypothetical protein
MAYHPKRFSTARWKALAWFDDHERDINLVLGRRPPTKWMMTRMIQAGQLMMAETNLGSVFKPMLTRKGRADLESKWGRSALNFRIAQRSLERKRRRKLDLWRAGYTPRKPAARSSA